METKTILVKGTFRGTVPSIILFIAWIILCKFLHAWAEAHLHSRSPMEMVTGLDSYTSELQLYAIAAVFLSAAMICLGIAVIYAGLYGAADQITFFLDAEGKIETIHQETIGFLYRKTITEMSCDRILGVSVAQSTVSGMLGVGSLTISFVAFANASIEEQSWCIDSVVNPVALKQQILAASPKHQGVRVQ